MAKISDFELLKALHSELVKTLEERKKINTLIPRSCCKAKIRRLRLQIHDVMFRIEQKCEGNFKCGDKEAWE